MADPIFFYFDFGSPFFPIDGEAFWGADRMDQVDRWLERGGW